MTERLPQVMPAGGQVVAVIPQSVEEIFRVSRGVIAAGLAPYSLTGKKTPQQQEAAVAITIMAGAELGLPPMVALRAFTVINGRPALYGDGLVAVIRKSGKLKFLKQGYDHESHFGWAEAERSDTGEVMRYEFHKQEAIDAGLWDERKTIRNYKGEEIPNPEPWFRWKPRMMMIRARTFVLRDLFADVLGGMTDEYEAREISAPVDITPRERVTADNLPEVPPDDPPSGGAPVSQNPASNDAQKRDTPADAAGDFTDDASDVTTHPATGEPMIDNRTAPDWDTYFSRLDEELKPYDTEDAFVAAWEEFKVDQAVADNEDAADRAAKLRTAHLARIDGLNRTVAETEQDQGSLLDGLPEVPEE